MKKGGKRFIGIPPTLAYGEKVGEIVINISSHFYPDKLCC